jgi:hypothetical protein
MAKLGIEMMLEFLFQCKLCIIQFDLVKGAKGLSINEN